MVLQWAVPNHMSSSFAVQPQSGLLQGNQRQAITWTFAPSDKATYDASMTCSYGSPQHAALEDAQSIGQLQTALSGPSETAPGQQATAAVKALSQQVRVRLVGQGTIGALTLEPSLIDFGTVAVGFPAVKEITLLNQSGGNLNYSISCTVTTSLSTAQMLSATGSSSITDNSTHKQNLKADPESLDCEAARHLVIEEPAGSLPARATKTLRLTLNPVRRKQYTLQLVCCTATAGMPGVPNPGSAIGAAVMPATLSPPPVCATVAAFSTYPTVMITDIACQGLDKPFVWNQMACSQINTELAAEMTQVHPAHEIFNQVPVMHAFISSMCKPWCQLKASMSSCKDGRASPVCSCFHMLGLSTLRRL